MYIGYYKSPVGLMKISGNGKAIYAIDLVSEQIEKEKLNKIVIQCKKELDEYFLKTRTTFTFPYEFHGTDFQIDVWKELLNVPFGKTKSYKEIARNINNEAGVRVVANAIGKNRLLIVVPCHRVIGSNGTLTGFACGLDKKEYLLRHEGINNYLK